MRSGILKITLACIAFATSEIQQQAIAVPNIVFVFADDLGWSDTSNSLTNMGNPSDYYETPALETIAAEGMAFTNAYTSGPNCAPTRAALLTGQYAQRPTNNVYLVNSLNRGGSNTLLVGPSQGLPTGTDAIPNNSFTYAEMLQGAGYRTAHFGKFHVVEEGTASSDIVNFHGFHENFGGNTNGGPGAYHANNGTFGGSISSSLDAYAANYTQEYVNANIKPYANGTSLAEIDALVGTSKHVSDALADAAIDFMEQEKNGSFFLNFNAYAVHTPIGDTQARDDLLHKYSNKPAGVQDSDASFGALIEGLDQSVARLVDYLETTDDPNNPGQKLDQNTILFFYSDNGGRQNQSNNGPLSGQKGELLEGGIRVPLIAWSGNSALVDGGTINSTPVASIDFYKTFANLSGAGDPAGVTLDGEDLTSILADNTADLGRDSLFWHLPGYLDDSARDQFPQSIVRNGDMKLVYNYENQVTELYDLSNDISESTNIALANASLVDDLSQELMLWLYQLESPLATLRSGSLNLIITGAAYANGTITNYDNEIITINAGEEVPMVIDTFFNFADLDGDGDADADDWTAFKSGQGTDMTGLSIQQSYAIGDLNGDLDNDFEDFITFKSSYEFFNGAGSFNQLIASVPEPSGSILLLGMISGVLAKRKGSL